MDLYPAIPPRIRMLVAIICGCILLSALALAVAGVFQPLLARDAKPAWILVGFECVSIVAAVLGILFSRGMFRQGPGLALACIAGTILLGSGLGGFSAQWAIGNQSIKILVAARAAAAVMIGLCGAACVLGRDPRGWPTFIKGLLYGSPILALGVWFAIKGGAFLAAVNGLSTMGMVIAYGAGSLILAISLCMSVHLVVKAFEYGRFSQDQLGAGESS